MLAHRTGTFAPLTRALTASLCWFALIGSVLAQAPVEGDPFQKQVEPILVRRCLECHGAGKRGGLDLRTRESLAKGGDSGTVVEPGKPDESLLFEHIASGQMPPKHPLPADEVATLKRWIEAGAHFPDRSLDLYSYSTNRRAGYDWWSLQPVARSEPPRNGIDLENRSEIDAFLLARLKGEGLAFAEETDRATYLRRVMHDLHGLPPTFEEVRAFIADERPDAYERLVDRLLASPRYGERWGRHWLDVVRFAESNGFERDRLRTNFWRYRDYVIAAFNRDLPYNQFVREQLAGDVLRPDDPEALVATGFLAGGPKNDVGTISELEKLITRQDELDEYVVATGTTFLGLTIGCARCHDHKFDPIPTRDYYAMTAVFSGLDRGDNVVALPEEKARHAAAVREVQGQISPLKAELAKLLDPVRERLLAKLAADNPKDPAEKLPSVTAGRNEDLFPAAEAKHVRFVILATNDGTQPCLDELEIRGAEADRNLALAEAGTKATATSLLPGHPIHQVRHLNDGKYGNAWSWISNEAGKGTVQLELAQAAKIERVIWSRDREAKYRDRIPVDYVIDVSLDGNTWSTVSSSLRRLPFSDSANEKGKVSEQSVLAALTPAEQATHARLSAELQRLEQRLKEIPALPVSYSARDGTMAEAFVLNRGNVRDRGEAVLPVGLRAVPAVTVKLRDPEHDSGPERRRRLAEWIVDPANPLTARVFVNRVWHYHFGRGLVGTPSDFGFNGDRPTHPELLDWVAADFMEQGWQIKRLQRMIVLSRAYRQSSRYNERAAAKDADNRWYWRMSPRRLESEALRDAILQASGTLSPAMGGPSFALFQYRDGNVPDYVPLQQSGPETWRRAVYMYNIRTFHEPLMGAFDCPDPSVQTPRRERSTTALQALSLMNNAFVAEQTRLFAERVRAAAGKDAPPTALAGAAYRLALAREPSGEETAAAARFVEEQDLFSLCRVLLNTHEFLYVR